LLIVEKKYFGFPLNYPQTFLFNSIFFNIINTNFIL